MIILNFVIETIKFIIYCSLIVLISKYILAGTIRKLAMNLKLSSKIVGGIAGYATSVPEFLTVAASSINGLMGASMYNILSSNIINFLQYMSSILINKNQRLLNRHLIKIELLLVIATILLPIIFINLDIELNIITVILFIGLYVLFKYIDGNAHRLYLKTQENEEDDKKESKEWRKSTKYIVLLIVCTVLLFVVGELLGETLEKLCYSFNIPEITIGILLGFITSIPELITFFEAQKHHKKSNNHEHGVIEATNNLFTSNISNLFIIQSIGILIYRIFA